MTKFPYIVTAVILCLMGLFAILQTTWVHFDYFVLSLLMLLALFWFGWLIFQYFTTFKEELEEEYKKFRAQTVNAQNLTAHQFDENEAEERKLFNRKMVKVKLAKLFMILACLAAAVAVLVAIIMK